MFPSLGSILFLFTSSWFSPLRLGCLAQLAGTTYTLFFEKAPRIGWKWRWSKLIARIPPMGGAHFLKRTISIHFIWQFGSGCTSSMRINDFLIRSEIRKMEFVLVGLPQKWFRRTCSDDFRVWKELFRAEHCDRRPFFRSYALGLPASPVSEGST